MAEINELIKRYIFLVLSLAEHDADYLDTYYGPDFILEEAKKRGKVELETLVTETQDLASEIKDSDDFKAGRKEYLLAQLRALETTMRMQLGELMSVTEKVENIFGYKPERVDESEFEEAYRLLDACLPGKGSIAERSRTYDDTMRIPVEKLKSLCNFVLAELRERTRQRFGLPDGEQVDLQLVTNRPFTAGCYYKGDGRSLLELNTEAPFFFLHYLIGLIAHELYPGHHTEYCLKETHLIREQGRQELWIVPSIAPRIFMAEMIATHAREMIITDDEYVGLLHEELLPRSKLKVPELGVPLGVIKANRMLAPVSMNAIFMYWDDGIKEEEIKKYYMRYGHYTEEQATQAVQWDKHPVFHVYTFSYYPSYRLLEDVLSHSPDPHKVFGRLLREAPLPSTILSW